MLMSFCCKAVLRLQDVGPADERMLHGAVDVDVTVGERHRRRSARA